MSIYQAPQVPQPAVTFGGGNYVDLSTVNMLQAQNAALQQENVALKSANQSLQQQRENPLCKAANRAYLREFTAYKTESLVEFPDGRYHLVKENPLGELYKVVKPVSDCTEFSARYAIDPRDGSTSIEVRYRLPNGTLSGFRVADDKFQQNALIQGFYKSGGTLRWEMYGMSIYQAPQVPQPAVTFGGGNYVDLSTVNMLQAQNAALQQENVALKSANQSLQQQRENPLCKAANRAYLREFTAYKTESLVEFPDGRYHLVKENPLGELYKVVKPVSDCTEFSARYAIDPRDGSTSIEVRYRLPNGTLSGFRVADDKFQQNALIQGFYKSGGTLRCGKDGPRLFYMLVAQLLSKQEIYFQPIPGWNINASRWFFKESAGCEAPLDSPILRPDALTSEDQMMMAAVIGLSFLKTRLPEDMQPTKPFAVISESFSITTEITLNCKLAELKKQLNHHRDDLLIHVRGGFASNRYQKATNYDYLSDEAEKGSTSRSIYIVQAKELTPEIREHCIPIQLNPAEACSATTGVDSVTWGDLISLVEGNPNEFDSRVYRAYKEERDRMEGSNFCQEIAVLRAVSEIICWTFSQKASFSEEKVRDAYKTAFDHYPSRWDSMLNTTASDCFRNALYAAAREQTIRFRDIGDLDETYCKEKEVLYDEYKLYLTLDLVKRLVAKRMPEFLTSDVLAQLTEAGILSSSIVKTLTLSTGHSKNVRLRSINRSFVNGYGRRDITTIST